MTMLKLLGAPGSPFFRKCRIVLEEKRIPYEPVLLRPFPKTPELLAMNPLGKVPILEDGDRYVPDSSVICAYLERCHPEPPMYPADAADYARALFLEEFADTTLNGATIWLYVERVLHDECDEARVAKILAEDLPPALDILESQMPQGRDTLLGEFGIADASVIVHLCSIEQSGEAIDEARWPKTAAYFAAHRARPSVATSLQAL